MPHRESFYKALDKRLEQKMTIDEIARELCNNTKDPRRNMILDIKEHKGEDWLIANAEWLGYDLGHAFAGRQTQEQAKRAAIRCSNDLLQHIQNVCDNDERVKEIYKRLGIIDETCICGHLMSQHNDTSIEKGHGKCKYSDWEFDEETEKFINKGTCTCYRFKWRKFLYNR